MEKDELLKRVLMMQRLQGMGTEPISAEDPYASMEKDQLISMIHFLVKREDERAQENQELKDMVKDLRDTHKQDVKTQTNLLKSIDRLTNQVADLTTQNKTLQQKVNDLLSQISVGNKVRFGSTSQKGTKKKAAPVQDREKDKDDFDGTNGAVLSSTSQTDTSSSDADPESAEQTKKSYENRIGLKYQTMNADNRIVHESDVNLLPEGATIIKSVYESTYEQVSYIVQHDYEMIIYKDKDGIMRKGYFPKAEESAEIDRIPGTHASCSLLANLVFNKYHMNTPVYREMVRLLNNKMNVSRNTVYNWFVKGSEYLNKVLPILKEKLLAKGAVVNCDETWCRVKVAGKYGKKYIWCMVNKEAKIAVYFYDDGSRGRKVLREFLDRTEIDALQSDGFNVYMYLDKELVDVDHLCCLAHARAKFKYALEQGKDEEAEYFIRNIGRLYDLEELYRMRHLTPEQIRQERQGEKTIKIITQIRQRLDKLLVDGNGMRGDLMQKALNYLKSFWDQLFLYIKDGRYCIDNSLAERTLRPMTVERKNSLTFGSHAGAKVSVIYHTFIETCKMCGVSTLEYFKEFFKAIMQGRTDYENMLPMNIGIKK
ncbi:IS66 family transposase [Prevotella sp. P6B4]|uniref:IS66 family transposase n=3 Tax=Prevotella sp. P6B4 TaxID=1410614 RepID=UPI00048B5E45|nr:IS66 family transposase [Prevotella sp. P6B4]